MSIFRGFVQTIQVRGDGWVETVLQAVHAGNATLTFFIPNLDGDLTQSNKRLGHLSLLRDALTRILPVELDYTQTTDQGNLVNNVTVTPRPSIDGRVGKRTVEGVVIGLGIVELGPLSGSSPYRDSPDLANVVILTDAGVVQGLLLDLQRPDPLTAQAELRLLQHAHRTRRPVEVLVSVDDRPKSDNSPKASDVVIFGGGGAQSTAEGYIQATAWKTLPEADLNYVHAFVERLGQRYESYVTSAAPAVSRVKIVYTTAPDQTPEGDVSEDGSFTSQRLTAWVHDDSPLLSRLAEALRDSLQVKLGLQEDKIHEVEIVAHLGSAARPIWIVEDFRLTAGDQDSGPCTNVPTIQGPSGAAFNNIPRTITWKGKAYFNEGVWRFVIGIGASGRLKIDGHGICSSQAAQDNMQEHAYLKGMHEVELELSGVTCSSNFAIQIYRIR